MAGCDKRNAAPLTAQTLFQDLKKRHVIIEYDSDEVDIDHRFASDSAQRAERAKYNSNRNIPEVLHGLSRNRDTCRPSSYDDHVLNAQLVPMKCDPDNRSELVKQRTNRAPRTLFRAERGKYNSDQNFPEALHSLSCNCDTCRPSSYDDHVRNAQLAPMKCDPDNRSELVKQRTNRAPRTLLRAERGKYNSDQNFPEALHSLSCNCDTCRPSSYDGHVRNAQLAPKKCDPDNRSELVKQRTNRAPRTLLRVERGKYNSDQNFPEALHNLSCNYDTCQQSSYDDYVRIAQLAPMKCDTDNRSELVKQRTNRAPTALLRNEVKWYQGLSSDENSDIVSDSEDVPNSAFTEDSDSSAADPQEHDSHSSEDNEKIKEEGNASSPVKVYLRDKSKKNKWDKKHACRFCNKLVTKISSHMQRVHKTEPEVVKVMMMKVGSQERRRAWATLLNEGDYAHNYRVLRENSGQLIPKYRTCKKKVSHYVACPHCKALYSKALISVHTGKCFRNVGKEKCKKGQSAARGRLLLPVPCNTTSLFYHNVLARMRDDEISRLILHDSLILKFGERKYLKRDVEEHVPGDISSRLRELGKLVKLLREKSGMKVANLNQAIDSAHFDLLVECVKDLGGFDSTTHHFQKGSVALKLGYSMRTCSQIKGTEAIKNRDQEQLDQATKFDSVFKGDWYDHISAGAAQSVKKARMNKPKLLPTCMEIEKLTKHLEQKSKSMQYATLAKATLCSVSLFNRKRGGEVQRMKCEDYERGVKAGVTTDPEILMDLTQTEKQMVKYFDRLEIRGKFNRPVPVLLTPNMTENLRKLMRLRREQTSINSRYVFATPTGHRPYRGSDVIREFAMEAGINAQSAFTFTNLRRQVATMSQALEISNLDQEQLADFLGHDIRVHRSIYRQPVDVLQKAKVAKILLAVNRGMVNSSDLSQDLDENEEIEVDEQNSTDSDSSDNEELEETEDREPAETCSSTCISKRMPETCSGKRIKSGAEITQSAVVKTEQNVQSPYVTQSGFGSTSGQHQGQTSSRQKKIPWSPDEIAAVKRQLSGCIVLNRVLRKDEAMRAIHSEAALKSRSWTNVKDFVYNLVKKSRKDF